MLIRRAWCWWDAQCEHGTDATLEVRAFNDGDGVASAAFADYHGIVEVRKAFRLGVMAAAPLETCTWLFRLRRRRFQLEPLTLPPDLAAATGAGSGAASRGSSSSASGCGDPALEF